MAKVRVRTDDGRGGWLTDEHGGNPLVELDSRTGAVPELLDPTKANVVVPKEGLESEQKYLVTDAILRSGYKFKYD